MVDASILQSVIGTSTSTIGQVLVICSAGTMLWRLAILDTQTIGRVSKMCYTILSPCLLFSGADAFKLQNLLKWAVLPASCLVHMGCAALLAFCGSRLARLGPPETKMVLLACGFHNLGSLPFVFVAALTRTWARLEDDADALERGFAMVFVYAIPWMGALYSIGLVAVRAHIDEDESDQPSYHQTRDEESGQTDVMDKPCNELGNDSGSAVELGLTTSPKEESKVADEKCSTVTRNALCCWFNAPQTRSLLASLVVGLVTPLRHVFFGASAPLGFVPAGAKTLGTGGIAISTIVLAANLSRAAGIKQQELPNQPVPLNAAAEQSTNSLRMSVRAMVVCCSVKLVITPLVCSVLTVMVLKSGILGIPSELDPLMVFILMVEPAMPSAQNLVVLYNNEGHADGATRLSSVYIVQYLFAVVTMSFWVIVALTTVESLLGPS